MYKEPRENWEIRMMREYRAGGWSHAELAFFFEMSQSAVSKACKGLSYRDAGGPLEELRNYRRQ
jgi:hypothetical protein